ncbi:hypothetical protein N9L68_06450 [bacterium]|nr:hypothetical protein [bacterium]
MVWPMVCVVCDQTRLTRGQWFKPQWERWEPVVMGHPGGDFDRCQECNYNTREHAPARVRRRRDDRAATILAQEIERLSRTLATWEVPCSLDEPSDIGQNISSVRCRGCRQRHGPKSNQNSGRALDL